MESMNPNAIERVPESTLRRETEELDTEINNIQRQVDALSDVHQEIEETAKRFAGLPSQVLVGIAGGVAGAVGGIALPAVVTGVAVVVSGPLGMTLGIATAILAWRSRNSIMNQEINSGKLDYKLQEFRKSLQRVREEIEVLESFLIKNVKSISGDESSEEMKSLWVRRRESIDKLWKQYDEMAEIYTKGITDNVLNPRATSQETIIDVSVNEIS
jgi:hypothetical protein